MNRADKDIDIEQYIKRLEKQLNLEHKDRSAYYQAIVDAPFADPLTATKLDLGITVLLLVNQENKTIDRIALSKTEQAKKTLQMTAKPFHEIRIPVNHPTNIISQAIKEHSPQHTEDWQYLFVPELTPQQARFNQAGAGIECSMVYPLNIPEGGAFIYSYYQPYGNLTKTHKEFMTAYTNRISWLLDSESKEKKA